MNSVGRTALTVGALGVVFGDIGTSPIYTIQTIVNPAGSRISVRPPHRPRP